MESNGEEVVRFRRISEASAVYQPVSRMGFGKCFVHVWCLESKHNINKAMSICAEIRVW